MIRDLIDEKYKEFVNDIDNKGVQPSMLYMDPFYLALLSEELGYDVNDFENNIHSLTYYKGMKLEALMEDSNEIIKII